jgi:pullulanase/glycogen debranching enzyme
MKANMLRVQKALGSAVYLYGEGWNFGEVANNQRGINATQLNMSATGIGSFNDRFRDAVRGGGAFDCGVLLYQQGYGNGLYTDLNEAGGLLVPAVENPDCLQPETFQAAAPAAVREQFMALADRIRVGLVGSIKDYEFETVDGTVRRTDAIPYGGGLPTGYTTQPYESINYISKHDNQTLWDINQLKLPQDSTMAERIQAQEFGISLNLLAQGVPFFQLGIDLLRSKSLNRDSYNSGDWFNRVDYTGEIHNWNIGLPSQEKDGDNWPFIRDVVEAFPTRPGPDEIASMQQSFRKWLAIRYSSRLFRMRSAAAVKERLRFLNTGPKPQGREGLIHMKLHDESCRFGPKNDLDAGLNDAVVIVNPYPRTQDILAPGYRPHGLLADDVLRRGKDRFTIKARSTAVFIRPETAECRLDDVVQIL